MKAKVYYALFLCVLFFTVKETTYGQYYHWAYSKILTSQSNKAIQAFAKDDSGNVYLAGWYKGTIDINPGPGIYQLPVNSAESLFILKLTRWGDYVWAKAVQGPNDIECGAIAIDQSYNIYITGKYTGTVDFDPGPGISNLMGIQDMFILKLDYAGNFIFANSTSGSTCIPHSMVVEPVSDNIYIYGEYGGTVDFDASVALYNIASTNSSTDLFILKTDSFGGFIWAKSMGGTNTEKSSGMTFSQDYSALIITGEFGNVADFDPGP
jgi:hypothetical protein